MADCGEHNEETGRKCVAGRRHIPYAHDQTILVLRLFEHFRPAPNRILDLGCGEGTMARILLPVYRDLHAVLLDRSGPMLDRAREALGPAAGRVELVQADLADSILPYVQTGSLDGVLSGYAIHHLPDARKRTLYAEIYELLAPGGLFVNMELVASPTPELEAFFDRLYVDRMAGASGLPRDEVARHHHARPDRHESLLAPLEAQLGWLREAGFEQVDCYFKWLELAAFGGVKSG